MSSGIITEVDGQKVKLTNLEKLIYPHAGLVKAQVIKYYKDVAPLMLKYIGHRPLTLIRFPDGIEGKKFYSKDTPKWAPAWVQGVQLEGDHNNYVMVCRAVGLVWLANLAALEIHPMQLKVHQKVHPDHFIFDLDPSPKFSFDALKDIAWELKNYLTPMGYHPHIKTSGSKGLHLYVPINPKYEHKSFYETVKKLAQGFVDVHPKTCTLRISKERRLGKVLLDIYRNHRGNSCVSPYSLRARPMAPISMPFLWENLETVSSSQQFRIEDFDPNMKDPWHGFFDKAVDLHDQRAVVVGSGSLDDYDAKRDFASTSEPAAEVKYGGNDQFVVQLHDASNLHYDLRLEWDGVLLSWAIPKALPLSKDQSRLGIQTEDHPVKYLDFEGHIPKNEYGGGQMWIYDRGSYQMLKKEDKKIHIRLNGQFFKGEYKLINTKARQWLIKNLEGKISVPRFEPMLAAAAKKIPSPESHIFEVKWDGIRALITKNGDDVQIQSRSGSDLSQKFPELLKDLPVEAEQAVLDGEIVVLDEKGVSDFPKVISRMHSAKPSASAKPVVFYAYDLLYLDGRSVINESLLKRKEWLNAILKKGTYFRPSESFLDGEALFEAGRSMGLEGIMAKKKAAKYEPGSRSEAWVKIKYRSEIEAFIIGYTEGSGDRMDYFGSLHLAVRVEDEWSYIGKVGSGFNQTLLGDLKERLADIPRGSKFIDAEIDEESKTTWVEPRMQCKVRFASWTNSRTLREPVFLELLEGGSA